MGGETLPRKGVRGLIFDNGLMMNEIDRVVEAIYHYCLKESPSCET